MYVNGYILYEFDLQRGLKKPPTSSFTKKKKELEEFHSKYYSTYLTRYHNPNVKLNYTVGISIRFDSNFKRKQPLTRYFAV